ncbi:MAG: spermidine synthase [Desulfosalsimonadaceae bacterium]
MSALFEELDYQQTGLGELILRRRRMLGLKGVEIYEVMLAGDFLMSSLFHESEEALANMALSALEAGGWDIVVGGLGLGYTAAAALKFDQVKRLVVVEALGPVIEWHKADMVPNSRMLCDDRRCIFHQGDFFALARTTGFDPEEPNHRFDAILLDIDHTPEDLLSESHGDFYTPAGMQRIKSFLKPGGILAVWSNDPPKNDFLALLAGVFDQAEGHRVEFHNPLLHSTADNGIYLARCK